MKWHKHHGGPNPYAGLDEQGDPLPQPMVQAGFRNRTKSRDALPADKWRWKWGSPFPRDYDFDITHFMVASS